MRRRRSGKDVIASYFRWTERRTCHRLVSSQIFYLALQLEKPPALTPLDCTNDRAVAERITHLTGYVSEDLNSRFPHGLGEELERWIRESVERFVQEHLPTHDRNPTVARLSQQVSIEHQPTPEHTLAVTNTNHIPQGDHSTVLGGYTASVNHSKEEPTVNTTSDSAYFTMEFPQNSPHLFNLPDEIPLPWDFMEGDVTHGNVQSTTSGEDIISEWFSNGRNQ